MNIGLSNDDLTTSIGVLNTLLADEHLLYIKTRNYHWNVVGPHFHELHIFFESQYTTLEPVIDDIAERVRYLGGTALGTLKEFTDTARLAETPGKIPDAAHMLHNLVNDHEELTRLIRKDIEKCEGDVGTGDFLTGLLQLHEKAAWMLRSQAKGKQVALSEPEMA